METTSATARQLPRYQELRIIFMGTPAFAVASLEALLQAGCRIVAVITAPDKPAGRGMKLQESDVKKYAVEKGLRLLQPEKLKNPAFLEEVKSIQADLQVVVAFRMLPEILWSMPPMGTINLHGSLLPQYRGAAPIQWAIINGEKETGVTTFRLQKEIDTGNILLQKSFPIGAEDTAGDVHDRMKLIGAKLLVETVIGLADGSLQATPQDAWLAATGRAGQPLHHAPKISTETCRINWNKPVAEIHNLIRGLSPFPAAFTLFEGKTMKIFKSHQEQHTPEVPPGQYQTDKKTFIRFTAADGYVYVDELQLEGRKKLLTEDFLRGYRFA